MYIYNIIFRRVRAAIVAVEEQQVLRIVSVCVCVCVCSFRYPARNAHAPYCHMWPAPLYYIFKHYLIHDRLF